MRIGYYIFRGPETKPEFFNRWRSAGGTGGRYEPNFDNDRPCLYTKLNGMEGAKQVVQDIHRNSTERVEIMEIHSGAIHYVS